MTKKRCDAYQQQDEMFCPSCRLRWDVDDADPPRCPKVDPPKADSRQLDLFTR